jgi:tetratricopeptide (TPR) repeat protein
VPATDPHEQYSREAVRRVLGVSEKRLKSWEKAGLIPHSDTFTFKDLIALRALHQLVESKIAPRQIKRAIDSLKAKLTGIEKPLSELRIFSNGKTIEVQVSGQKMEAISGQLLFDFEARELGAVQTLEPKPAPKPASPKLAVNEAEQWFQRGLTLEETGAPPDQALEAYRKAIELNPNAAGALVNLGTIAFRSQRLHDAIIYYQRAIEADPRYPLAHFNLGNVYDEMGQLDPAREQYELALRLNPGYADAHFNLALVAERKSDHLRAVKHWKAYLKLDPSSSWADQARKQLEQLRRLTVVE